MTTKRQKICNTPECRRMRALISDYLDRTLPWRTARLLGRHLAVCPACRDFAATIERTILLYRERPKVDVPVAVRGHLRKLLRLRHERAPRGRAGRCRTAAAPTTVTGRGSKAAKKPPAKP